MSTLTDYILSRSGLVGLWPLDEVAGNATIADLGPNALTGTPINGTTSQNALGATGFVNGHTRAWAGGATNAGWQLAIASNVLLQLQTYALGVFNLHTASTSAAQLLGRQNGWLLQTVTTGNRVHFLSGLAGAFNRAGNATVTSNNVGHLLGGQYDGQNIQPILDGEFEGAPTHQVATLASFPNRVVVGGDTGQANANHMLSVAFIFNRPLTRGEWSTIYRLGLGEQTSDQQALNYAADYIPVITSGATGAPCEGCGYKRRVGEGGVKLTSPTREWHLACFGATGAWQSTALPALSSTNTDFEQDVYISKTVDAVVDFYLKRPTSDKVFYMRADGKLMGLSYTLMSANYGGILGALGLLHRRWASGSGSHYLHAMKKIMAYLRSTQIPAVQPTPYASDPSDYHGYFSDDGTTATNFGGNGDFTTKELLPGVIAVWDDLDSITQTTWLDTLRKAAQGMYDQDTTGGTSGYYANGNVATTCWSIYRMMAKLDPSGPWMDYANEQLLHAIKPLIGGTPATSGLTTCGLKRFVDGTSANDPFINLSTMRGLNPDTDKAYFTEANGAGDKGLDWNYTMAQFTIAALVYLVTEDPDALQMARLHYNTFRPRENYTNGTVTGPSGASVQAWWADFVGGTRHNVVEYSGASAVRLGRRILLKIGESTDVTGQNIADHWVYEKNDAALNTTQQTVWYRLAGTQAHALIASPHWPGFPEIS